MCVPWVPKFSGEEGTVKFGEWQVQVQAMLRAQALTEEQHADFVLGSCWECGRTSAFCGRSWKNGMGGRRRWQSPGADNGWGCRCLTTNLTSVSYFPGGASRSLAGRTRTMPCCETLLGLQHWSLKQELQWQVRCQASLTFRQVPAHSEVLRWGGDLADGQCGLVEGVDDGGEWKVARGLVRVQGGRVLLRIANIHPYTIELSCQRPLVTIAGIVQGACDIVLQTPSPREVVMDVRTTEALAGVERPLDRPEAEGLTRNQQQWFQGLMHRWAGVFAAHKEDFGKMDTVLHNIPTGDAPPSHERYCPLPPSLFPELRSLLREMLESG
ncbi:hypothetical protein SKAU_G00157370 [Synaphobranchus kaupii]|uniref:Uncharacterized protein n=1 Tax=Synaphobranchus kaupii TaxID=118154 RepID=A0A9Q1FHT5_SYNKA|nr:hypothetical protein SKAU_G00157370 [Synaphobranchus kaupii]